jgi:hypothetical protein
MAGRKVIQAVGPSYQRSDRKASVQRSVNLRLRNTDSGQVLESIEGLRELVTLPADIRGTYTTDEGRWFVVAGAVLYEVTSAGTYTARGTLASSSGFVSMKNGLYQLVIVDGPSGYVFSFATNTLAQITDSDWRGSRWVEELNGTFVFVPDDAPDQFYISAIDDGSSFDALDFSSSDAQPDNIITHRVLKQELYLFNKRSTEVWIYTGDEFPLVRYNSTPIDIGCVGLRAATVTSDSMFWVGCTDRGSGLVYEMRGHSPVRVSQDAVEQAIAASSDISAARMWAYQIDGAEFVGLDAPDMPTAWVYNLATQEWHEQAKLVAGAWTQWPVDQISYFDNTHFATSGATIYVIDKALDTIDGEAMSFERTWPHLSAPSMEPITYAGLEVSVTTGGKTGVGAITLELSNDGGYVYGPPLRKTLGAIGARTERIRWLGLGSAENRVFRLRWSNAGPSSLYEAAVDAK